MSSSVKSLLPKFHRVIKRGSALSNCLMQAELGSRLVAAHYPHGTQLCSEGQRAAGIFSICKGQAKEYSTSAAGKAVITRIIKPGDVVGLEAVMGDSIYLATVETIEPT